VQVFHREFLKKERSNGQLNYEMSTNAIPAEVKEEALMAIARYNQEVLAEGECFYIPRIRGKHLYLDREELGTLMSIGRLEYNRSKRFWLFAIYKYSDSSYDPEKWFFPGNEIVDGTNEGAMEAGMQAYP
jgi:hypothetical protein